MQGVKKARRRERCESTNAAQHAELFINRLLLRHLCCRGCSIAGLQHHLCRAGYAGGGSGWRTIRNGQDAFDVVERIVGAVGIVQNRISSKTNYGGSCRTAVGYVEFRECFCF